jgi:threonylcarbamoyladenosine tRNA methylthiotransferase MtaB
MKIHITTLGCKVNQYESGQIAAKYIAGGHEITKNIKDADICVVNTCAVTNFAEKKSRYQVARIKRVNPDAEIIICGCAADRKLNESVCGFKSVQTRKKVYIKIQDGCNNFCSYCIVPHLRGRSTSRPLRDVLAEVRATQKPIVLTGIDISSYADLHELCAAADRPFELSSMEVRIINDEFLQILKNNKNFIPNFHLCLQSGCDRVLAAMNRKYTTAEYLARVALIRKYFPNARLTTDVICGFPTETDEDFSETVAFIKKINFANIHVFPYSRRTGTRAAGLPQVQDSVITKRTKVLQDIQ